MSGSWVWEKSVEDADYKKSKTIENYPVRFGSFPVALDKEKLERVRHDMELNQKLGLESQNNALAKETISENVDKVLSEFKYPEVNKDGLLKLFGLQGLKKIIFKHNLWVIISQGILYPVLFLSLAITSVKFCSFCFDHATNKEALVWQNLILIPGILSAGFAIFFGLVVIGCFAGFLTNDVPDKFETNLIKLDLQIDPIARTSVKIPYGAKLHLEEAMGTKLFSGFYLVHPKIGSLYEKLRFVDPAIVGYTTIENEEKWYLICYWDLEKDQARVLRELNDITKMKGLKV